MRSTGVTAVSCARPESRARGAELSQREVVHGCDVQPQVCIALHRKPARGAELSQRGLDRARAGAN